MANGITSPEPHLEHFHRRARATTVVHGLCWAMSSSIGQRCLWPQAVTVGAYGRDLAVVLEEGERHLPSLAGDFSSIAGW